MPGGAQFSKKIYYVSGQWKGDENFDIGFQNFITRICWTTKKKKVYPPFLNKMTYSWKNILKIVLIEILNETKFT